VENGKLVNRTFVFRRGNVILTQDKAHLMPMEEKWGMSRGSRLGLFDLGTQRLVFWCAWMLLTMSNHAY